SSAQPGAGELCLGSDPVEYRGNLARAVQHSVVARVEGHHAHRVAQVRRHAILVAGRERPPVAEALDVRAGRRGSAAPPDRLTNQGGGLLRETVTGPARPGGVPAVEERPPAHAETLRELPAGKPKPQAGGEPPQGRDNSGK